MTPAEREARRRRLAEVFGDVHPEQTRDDTDAAESRRTLDDSDARLLREVPPHHGS